jgi:hypothetical protein
MPKCPKVFIKTSKHPLLDLNSSKLAILRQFISDYQNAISFYVNYIWNNDIHYAIGDKEHTFSIAKDLLNLPLFISTTNIKYESPLYARALKCAIAQACSAIKSSVDKRRKLLYCFHKLQEEHKRTRSITKRIKNVSW